MFVGKLKQTLVLLEQDEISRMQLQAKTLEQLSNRLRMLYGSQNAEELCHRIDTIAHKHRLQCEYTPRKTQWDESDIVLITYGDSIQAASEYPLETLHHFCKHRLADSISTVHLLPFFPFSSDDGFSVIDYRTVDSTLGNWESIKQLSGDFDLMFDFVLNHVSRESLWFADFMEHMPPGNHYFIEVDPHQNLSEVVRPRSSPVLVPIRTRHDLRYVWATFSKDQIDLNYSNPDVLMQAIDILLYYVRQGARILRLDAVAFLWKEIGTPCIHLPQTHEVIKLMRDLLEDIAPGVLLLTETNVPHQENIRYFGSGDEAHMVYQFSLPPLMLHAIHTQSTNHLRNWLQQLPPAPENCTFLNFTASHDGVGLRPLEGLLSEQDVKQLLEDMRERGGYISTRRQPDGSETPYELNISYFDALRDPSAHYDKWHIQRFLLSQTVTLSLQGIPALYIHSLVATPNDQVGVERTGRTRSINRRKWDYRELERLLDNHQTEASRVFNALQKRLVLRRKLKAFHPDAMQQILSLGNDLLGILRTTRDGNEKILALYNFTPFAKTVSTTKLGLTANNEIQPLTDLISAENIRIETEKTRNALVLPPYACYWIKTR